MVDEVMLNNVFGYFDCVKFDLNLVWEGVVLDCSEYLVLDGEFYLLSSVIIE